jgi:hypothetical protein
MISLRPLQRQATHHYTSDSHEEEELIIYGGGGKEYPLIRPNEAIYNGKIEESSKSRCTNDYVRELRDKSGVRDGSP